MIVSDTPKAKGDRIVAAIDPDMHVMARMTERRARHAPVMGDAR